MVAPRPADIDRRLKAIEALEAMAKRSRTDPAAFCQFALRSERTNKPLHFHDGHHELLEMVNATVTATVDGKSVILPKHPRIVIVAGPKLGKSNLITYGTFLHRLGSDPTHYRGLIGSAKKMNANRHSLKVRGMIDSNERLKMVFPKLVPGLKWTEDEWTVEREGFAPKEPSCVTTGEDTREQGFRAQDHYYDDMVDPTVSASRYQCEKQAESIMDTESRVESNSQRFFIQNCFRRWDTGHLLAEKFGWHLHLMPAIDAMDRTLYPVLWPQEDCDKYAPARKDQDLRCIPKREGDSEFQEAWIQCALQAGCGMKLEHHVDYEDIRDRGGFIITGVDLASRKNKDSDETALVTCLVAPPEFFGMPPTRGTKTLVKRLLWVEHRKMFAPEIKAAVIDHSKRYNSLFLMEDNGGQALLVQMLASDCPDIPVSPFTTTASTKNHPETGMVGMANDMSTGMWIMPSQRDDSGTLRCEDGTEFLLNQMRLYDPESHSGDCLMAMWFCHVGAMKFGFRHQAGFAGYETSKEELFSLGYSESDIADAMPELLLPRKTSMSSDKDCTEKKEPTMEEKLKAAQLAQHAATVKKLTRPGWSPDEIDEDALDAVRDRFF